MKYLLEDEQNVIKYIKNKTHNYNLDNISRTNAYFHFYNLHPDVGWAFLASMVSRNAGWNMCDLEGIWFSQIIERDIRKLLYLTYEKANWLIFNDAFPQLMLYHYSTKIGEPMFHLLKKFHVSIFMQEEWNRYWKDKNKGRLMSSLIINEQNIIQTPVIEHPVYRKRVFHSLLFSFQDWFHFSSVLFPTCNGELFGASVNGFISLDKRIELGKRLANILFQPPLYPLFYQFAQKTTHTGSRYDYEQYFRKKRPRTTPFLRTTFPVIKHQIHEFNDWSRKKNIKKKWTSSRINHIHPIKVTKWFSKKEKQLHTAIYIKKLFT